MGTPKSTPQDRFLGVSGHALGRDALGYPRGRKVAQIAQDSFADLLRVYRVADSQGQPLSFSRFLFEIFGKRRRWGLGPF
jgi:hypothetical protein